MKNKELQKQILEYIYKQEQTNAKKKMEYLEVGKDATKYEDLEYMFQVMYTLVTKGIDTVNEKEIIEGTDMY